MDPGQPVQIGFKELYDSITSLDRKLDEHMREQAPRVAVLEHQMSEVKEQLAETRADKRVSTGMKVSIALAVLSGLSGLVTALLIYALGA